jgi:hypothetical protein
MSLAASAGGYWFSRIHLDCQCAHSVAELRIRTMASQSSTVNVRHGIVTETLRPDGVPHECLKYDAFRSVPLV